MMASLKHGYGTLNRCSRSLSQWQQLQQQFQSLRISAPVPRTRSISSSANPGRSSRDGGIDAAPEIDMQALIQMNKLAEHARAVPVSPSYFSRQPYFTDSYLLLQRLLRSYKNLPVLPSSQAERVAWKSLDDYRLAVGEQVKATEYIRCMEIAKRLHYIHPKLKPPAVAEAVRDFMKDIQPFSNVPAPIVIDRFGRALGVGKRKSSTARAWVVEGTGEVLVNGKSLADAFGRVHDRESAVWSLKSTERIDKYNVWALVEGGGTTGQAEALTLAIAKALMAHEPALKPALRRGKLRRIIIGLHPGQPWSRIFC